MVGAIIAFIIVFLFYFVNFHGELASKQDIWGQFGDYIGGILNPIFGFLALIVLVFTLALQSRQLELAQIQTENSRKELDATQKELKKSSAAQELTANSLVEQAEYASISAKLSALNSSLAIISEMVRQSRECATIDNSDNYKTLVDRKEKIADKILIITESLTNE